MSGVMRLVRPRHGGDDRGHLRLGAAPVPLVIGQVEPVEDDVGAGNGRPEAVEAVGIPGDKADTRQGAAIAAAKAGDGVARIAEGPRCMVAEMTVNAQYGDVALAHEDLRLVMDQMWGIHYRGDIHQLHRAGLQK
jgi:hypothetical protein